MILRWYFDMEKRKKTRFKCCSNCKSCCLIRIKALMWNQVTFFTLCFKFQLKSCFVYLSIEQGILDRQNETGQKWKAVIRTPAPTNESQELLSTTKREQTNLPPHWMECYIPKALYSPQKKTKTLSSPFATPEINIRVVTKRLILSQT